MATDPEPPPWGEEKLLKEEWLRVGSDSRSNASPFPETKFKVRF